LQVLACLLQLQAHAPNEAKPPTANPPHRTHPNQTPQWREGPHGPRTLCNACGMRYQRSQGKGQNRPRRAGSDDNEFGERKAARTARGRGRGRSRRDDYSGSDEETEDLVLSDEAGDE